MLCKKRMTAKISRSKRLANLFVCKTNFPHGKFLLTIKFSRQTTVKMKCKQAEKCKYINIYKYVYISATISHIAI